MELRHLRYFVTVAEEMNFTRAAARLSIAQPPLSVQIRRLEAEIGAQLFLRSGRQIALTDSGRVFLEHARHTLLVAERSVDLARRAARGEVGHLSIGYNTVAEFKVFPSIIPDFRRLYPGVHLSFHEFETAQQVSLLRDGAVDVGFVWLPFSGDEFEIRKLTRATFVVALPAAHRLASRPTVSLAELSDDPFLVFSRVLDPQTYREIEDLFQETEATMTVALELESLLSLLNFVAIGSGYALVPDYMQAVRREGVTYKTLKGRNVIKTLAVAKRRELGGIADAYYRFTVEKLANR